MKLITKLWIGLVILILLAPLGLIIPAYFRAGSAWGEWGAQDLKAMIGYIPQGLNKLSTLWKAPIPEYALNSNENGLPALSFGYIISALTGILAIVTAIYLFARILMKKR